MNQPIQTNLDERRPEVAKVEPPAAAPEILTHTLSVYLIDKPGVLAKLSLVFSRRGFNIGSLIVSPARTSGYSRMTITCSGSRDTLDQIIAQVGKLVDVVHVTDSNDRPSVQSELALVKLRVESDTRAQILQIGEHFEAKVVDFAPDSLVMRICGSSERLDSFLMIMAPYGIIEYVRTGKIAMSRGAELT
jgi:acetolactate synthase-1/3 small subunit